MAMATLKDNMIRKHLRHNLPKLWDVQRLVGCTDPRTDRDPLFGGGIELYPQND